MFVWRGDDEWGRRGRTDEVGLETPVIELIIAKRGAASSALDRSSRARSAAAAARRPFFFVTAAVVQGRLVLQVERTTIQVNVHVILVAE